MVKMTVFTAYNEAKKSLKDAGVESFGFEARQIIKHITGYSSSEIISKYNERLSPLQQTIYNDIITRRKNRYPLQYLLGCWSFYGMDFFVGEGVLIPRADTEILVDEALKYLKGKTMPDVADLCSGSGCIAAAIAKNAECSVDAVEKYDEAFGFLQKNIAKHRVPVHAVLADVFEFVPEKKYDLIVSNPPYVAAEEMEQTDPETQFEPDTALYGGEDGLMFYRFISAHYKPYIKEGGKIMFEVGYKQARAVSTILKENGYSGIGTKEDYNGIQRVVFGTVKSA